mmetsp:Transcript_12387/g.22955  ORF Transcript_12387/g.22955 Transcript_12387/m.22955 type:complete len:86 (-) Transcript_12387:470-727(-)
MAAFGIIRAMLRLTKQMLIKLQLLLKTLRPLSVGKTLLLRLLLELSVLYARGCRTHGGVDVGNGLAQELPLLNRQSDALLRWEQH